MKVDAPCIKLMLNSSTCATFWFGIWIAFNSVQPLWDYIGLQSVAWARFLSFVLSCVHFVWLNCFLSITIHENREPPRLWKYTYFRSMFCIARDTINSPKTVPSCRQCQWSQNKSHHYYLNNVWNCWIQYTHTHTKEARNHANPIQKRKSFNSHKNTPVPYLNQSKNHWL